ncbi:hypothetical protein F4782DRAFT_524405 [Xylaria castorea]|nr:hypothetical protein F4782DRAFT_524405 [Xylaria castorea]
MLWCTLVSHSLILWSLASSPHHSQASICSVYPSGTQHLLVTIGSVRWSLVIVLPCFPSLSGPLASLILRSWRK